MDSRVENVISMFNELTGTLYLYSLICLTNAGDDISTRENLGMALIYIVMLAVGVNTLKVVIMISIQIVKRIALKWRSKKITVKSIGTQTEKYEPAMPRIPEAAEEAEENPQETEQVKEEAKEAVQLVENFNMDQKWQGKPSMFGVNGENELAFPRIQTQRNVQQSWIDDDSIQQMT
ncbi:hypothetical protein FGO68_gene5503 [Halteria grandinella]|uniref:Uncharacterized protein n=1 Tax=Halteria grandinella TaxID=5974 RepID=A0A8J8SWU4_HALGN|nr:hypothetical protein FGO68_gene5503 [Halteria grandinella]